MAQDFQSKLAKAIKKRSKVLYVTNTDFAGACDIDESSIRRILNGQQNVTIKVLAQICVALEVKMSKLIAEAEQQS
jgi:DNA-binding Xre family transcriptional regulator